MMGEGEGRAMQITDFSDLYTEEERARFAACRELAPGLAYRPLISIVVPVYRTPVRLLNEMISSVVRQSYPEWELCIGTASGGDRELCRALEEWKRQDARIRVCTLTENKGISGNTNACFQMVRGEYTAMLDHDDLLTESALCEVALCLQGKGGERPDFLYSDQDMVDEGTKKRFNPLYKPGWSKDMMYSGNYITHFSVLRTSLIREIGGWDTTTDGAQDWDLFLKAAEHTDRIVGIPRILYHWRMASTSTASSMETKGYALDAQLRAVEGHLRRMGEPQARVHFYNRDIFKLQVVWNRRHKGNISVVIFDEGKRGSLWLLASLVRAALRLQEREIIVVSDDPKRLQAPAADGCIGLTVPEGSDWADGYDAGAAHASGEVLLFLTDRALPMTPKTLTELADWALYDKVAVAAPKILEEERTIREMGVALTEEGPKPMFRGCFADGTTACGKNYWYRDVHAADYSCFAIRRGIHEAAGGFRSREACRLEQMDLRKAQASADETQASADETQASVGAGQARAEREQPEVQGGFFPAMLEYCLRLERMGYRHVVSPYAEIRLLGGGQTMCDRLAGEIEALAAGQAEWKGFLVRHGLGERDCYYPAEYPAGGRA